MKYLMILFITVVGLVSCKKAKDLLDIPFTYTINNDYTLKKFADIEIPLPDSAFKTRSEDFPNNTQEEFRKRGADINKIKSLTIESVTLNIKAPAGQTFNFVKSVNIYLGAPGKGEVLIASKDNINTISPAPTTLNMDVQNANVIEYIKGTTYYFVFETRLVKTYTKDIELGSEMKVRAVANALN